MGIYALGRLEFAELFPGETEAVRKHLVEAKIFLAYRRDLNNLSIQEGRLRRQREKTPPRLLNRRALATAKPKSVLMKPRAPTSRPITTAGRTISTIPLRLGSNFHSGRSKFAPSIWSLTYSPTTRPINGNRPRKNSRIVGKSRLKRAAARNREDEESKLLSREAVPALPNYY